VRGVRFSVTEKVFFSERGAGVFSYIWDDFSPYEEKYILSLQRENFGEKISPIWGTLKE